MGTMLLVAAALAATSCTSPGSPNATSVSSTSTSSASSSAGQSPTTAPLGPSAPPPAAGATATSTPTDAATIPPDAQAQQPQAAPKPTFAPSEQKYLAARVPEGTDPNAVLQVGQDMCAQYEAVKAVDPKAVVSQLIEKSDAESAAAIANLCPGLQPELEAASHGFTDGDFTLGADAPKADNGPIAAGKYEAWNPSPSCTLAAYDAARHVIAESDGSSAVSIPAGAVRVVSTGCYTWLTA